MMNNFRRFIVLTLVKYLLVTLNSVVIAVVMMPLGDALKLMSRTQTLKVIFTTIMLLCSVYKTTATNIKNKIFRTHANHEIRLNQDVARGFIVMLRIYILQKKHINKKTPFHHL